MLGVAAGGPCGPGQAAPTEPTERVGAPPRVADPSAERRALAVLVAVDGLGPVTLGRLMAAHGSARAVLELAERGEVRALADAAASDDRRAPRTLPQAIVDTARRAEAIWRAIDRAAVELVALDEPDYPPRLRAIELPPHLLFVRGDRRALATSRAVAVVGTRRPSEGGRVVAGRIAGAIARCGAAVVSGLAVGIDGAAHTATLTEGGVTVAVLGGGHERLYPRAHRELAERICAGGGAVVSELAPEVEPTQGTFPQRNRIISGLSGATVVVEAGARSGALVTAHWALEQGRECFVVPGPIDRPASAGCLSLLRDAHGAARIVAGIPQLLEDLDLVEARPDEPPMPAIAAASLVELGPVPRRIAAELLAGHATTDELVAVTRYPVATVLAAITLLESSGLVVDVYGRLRPVGPLASRPATEMAPTREASP
jgi:DNA processing protein